MKKHFPPVPARQFLAATLLLGSLAIRSEAATPTPEPGGVHGGLVIQLGAGDAGLATRLSRTGRYLVHVLDASPAKVEAARKAIQADGNYGLSSAEILPEGAPLPYAENLVNCAIVTAPGASLSEVFRVLTPLGAIVAEKASGATGGQLEAAGFRSIETRAGSLVGRKPWPGDMDAWSHPRHAADGNAVSTDTIVGPPERVRWVAAATSEVEGMVSAGGRNFYGGLLARDSFNGLRLWHNDLRKGALNAADFAFPRLSRDLARPIASNEKLFAVVDGKLFALDAATGEAAVEYTGLSKPKQLLHHEDLVIASDDSAARAYDAATGKERWNFEAVGIGNLVAGHGMALLTHGNPKRGVKTEAVAIDLKSGDIRWRRSDHEWLGAVTRTVLQKDQIAFEVSSFSDHDAGNGIHIVSTKDGSLMWEKNFAPGMNHRRQARAMYLDSGLWILHGGKTNTADKAEMERLPIEVSSLDPLTGKTSVTYDAGLAHCFPPVATPYFMFAGVLDMTDLQSGKVVANRITKANCSSENGWVPANGLVYTTPKHCTCWPMLRGYVSMAPKSPGDNPAMKPLEEIEFPLERATTASSSPTPDRMPSTAKDWPFYRGDRWRSGSAAGPGPESLGTIWGARIAGQAEVAMIGDAPLGPILHDWRENAIVKGAVSAPVIANGLAYVARSHAHEVVALDADTGKVRWRFTAEGRVDTPPAIHRGLCIFGSASGHVHALRADSGEPVWRLRAAPTTERIVAYGQVESPWPVPGAILIIDDVAYFAAGRQPFADGGILIFAVDPMTGKRHWVQRIDTVPQKGYYENSGLEFDPFDIMHQEGDRITMSRWLITRDGKDVQVDKWNAFAKLNTGGGDAYVHRGSWTYGARHVHRFPGEARRRPLAVFRDKTVFSSLNGTTEIFRRDFDLENGEKFSPKWITGWAAAGAARKGEKPYRTYRLAEKASWKADPFTPAEERAKEKKFGTQLHNRLFALALAGNDRLYVVHEDGRLKALSTKDGSLLAERQVPPPAWDGLAIANERLYLSAQTGELLCLGAK